MTFQKLKPWPHDWDLHICYTCELYFSDNSLISYNGSELTFSYMSLPEYESIQENNVYSYFKYNNNLYAVCFKTINLIITAEVFKVIDILYDFQENIDIDINNTVIMFNNLLHIVHKIGQVQERNSFNYMKKIEEIIYKDFKGDDDNENSYDPSPSIVPSLCLSGS